MPIDLHIHSTVSDGTQTPAEIVPTALRIGLSAIALADHDSISGVPEALRVAAGTPLRVVPGVEINTDVGEKEVHILGYFVDVDDAPFNERLKAIRRARVERAVKIVERLNGLGVHLRIEDVLAASSGDSVGRPHVARALVATGQCASESHAFDMYLKVGRPAYVPRYQLAAGDAIQLILAAGGVPVLAHPGLLRDDGLAVKLCGEGLVGIEAYHCEHSPAVTEHYLRLARRHGLIVTGGSDSHGPLARKPVAVGSITVPDELLPPLEAAARGLSAAGQVGLAIPKRGIAAV